MSKKSNLVKTDDGWAIKSDLKIYTDLPDDITYTYCTYSKSRGLGLFVEEVRIDLLYTDRTSGPDDFIPDAPIYDVVFSQKIFQTIDRSHERVEIADINVRNIAYDYLSILNLIGDGLEHREFLTQVGFTNEQ